MYSVGALTPLARAQASGDIFGYREWKDCESRRSSAFIFSTKKSAEQVIFTHLIDRVKPHRESATKTLILVHRRELAEQAARHCKETYPEKTVEIEMGNLHASGKADITIASIQSINRPDTVTGDFGASRLSKFPPEEFKLVLVDEAHHIVATGYLDVLKHFNLSAEDLSPQSPALVGVSATLSRFDGLRLGAAIDHIVYHRDYVDMIGENWLSDVTFTTVQSTADVSNLGDSGSGDFQVKALSSAVNTLQANEITVKAWLERASDRTSTLVFCVDVEHILGMTATFKRHGIQAEYITGKTAKSERSKRLEAFKNKEFPVLVNCGVFTEGTDIPNIDCVLLARPTRSRNLLVQMIGRGMRLSPGKTDCYIIDMVSNLENGVVTVPTLFGLDPSEILDEAKIEDLEDLKEEQESKDEKEKEKEVVEGAQVTPTANVFNAQLTYTDYDSIHDLLDDTSKDQHIWRLSPLAWVSVERGRYVLVLSPKGDYLTIEQAEEESSKYEFQATITVHVPTPSFVRKGSPYLPPRIIARSGSFENIVRAADTFAQEKGVWHFMSRFQAWRKRPASEGQIDFLKKRLGPENQSKIEDITKGKAADMITKMHHGASAQFKRIKAEQRRAERAERADPKVREKVTVGPVRV
ncbi:MAG: hypothetical protein M1814_004384 [Vezdaea aestivalis]|nr:MAG: hypothetical protein M1814_004384 [Vezdaea aestivalis]